jgi:hypothetical protein
MRFKFVLREDGFNEIRNGSGQSQLQVVSAVKGEEALPPPPLMQGLWIRDLSIKALDLAPGGKLGAFVR